MIKTFTQDEFNDLMENSDHESEDYKYLASIDNEYIKKHALRFLGVVSKSIPDYIGILFNFDGKYCLSTLMRKNPIEPMSIFKSAKRVVNKWAEEYSPIYACNSSGNSKVIEWIRRMGFSIDRVDNGTVILKLEGKYV